MYQEVTSYWTFKIYRNENDNHYTGYNGWRCAYCGTTSLEKGFPSLEQFCHSCGAHMIEKPKIIEEPVKRKYTWE